nr:MAG TPA: hypothetical protein [Caudoviricetes sp.]
MLLGFEVISFIFYFITHFFNCKSLTFNSL